MLKHYAVDSSRLATLYYLRDGHCLQKSAAVLYILKDLGGICQCFFPLIYLPACLRDAVYLFISRHRYRWFGKKRSCMLPAPDIRERFIG
ncbi:thiol-disulfide oxidoreductase DCC family protein [Bacteroides sp.]